MCDAVVVITVSKYSSAVMNKVPSSIMYLIVVLWSVIQAPTSDVTLNGRAAYFQLLSCL